MQYARCSADVIKHHCVKSLGAVAYLMNVYHLKLP